MVITCQGYTKQVCYGLPGGAVLLVTDGGVLQEAVAATSNQTEKEESEMMKSAIWMQLYWGSASVFLSLLPPKSGSASLLHSIYHLLHQVALLC